MDTLRDVLRIITNHELHDSQSLQADDTDGFGPIRTTQPLAETRKQVKDSTLHNHIAEVCVSFLAVVPILQSFSGEPTRDKELTELVLHSDHNFHLIATLLLDKVRQQRLKLDLSDLDDFLRKIESLLMQYNYSRSEKLHLLVCRFLDSTSHLWLQDSVTDIEVGDNIRALCHWISKMLKENKIRSWKLRDHVACFFDRYLARNPTQEAWSRDGSVSSDSFPSALLPQLGADRDIRVRFRVAVANARLFAIARDVHHKALDLYCAIKDSLTLDLQECVYFFYIYFFK
jgi:ataxia telangiectasia mutated family protein